MKFCYFKLIRLNGILVHICHLIQTFLDFRIEELVKLIRNSNITFYLLMKNSCTLASLTKKDMVILGAKTSLEDHSWISICISMFLFGMICMDTHCGIFA